MPVLCTQCGKTWELDEEGCDCHEGDETEEGTETDDGLMKIYDRTRRPPEEQEQSEEEKERERQERRDLHEKNTPQPHIVPHEELRR